MRKIVPILALVLALGVAGMAEAQTRGTGILAGTVTDADGAPLPGVTVTATSPALIGQQTAFTAGDGAFRIPLLPPGVYEVTFELQGFARVVRQNVEVGVRRTTTLALGMSLATVEETITVTAKSPLVDVKSAKGASEYNDTLRNNLPETRGVGGDLMALAPEASIPVGGNAMSTPSFFGSSSNAYQVDGVTVTDPGGGAQFPFYSPDWFDVVEITTTGGGAEFGKASGSVFNVVTKSGGNAFHGEGNFFYQTDSSIGDNTEGITSEAPGVDFSNKPTINHRLDTSMNLGGPLYKDKLWFFIGYQLFDENYREAGVAFDQTQNSDRILGKFTWQANQDNRVIVSAMTDTYTLAGRPGVSWAEPEATVLEPSFNITPNITWNNVISPDAFLEVKYSGFYGFFDLVPTSDGPSSYDLGTGVLSGAYWGWYTYDRTRTSVQGNLTYFAEDVLGGDHSFKFGAEYEVNGTDDQARFGLNDAGEDWLYYPWYGEPYIAYSREGDGLERNTSNIKVLTLYAQDDWTIADRVTLNLGVRYDKWDIGWKGAERDDAPTFNDLAPRIGLSWDVTGEGTTALSAFYGRFYDEARGSAFDDFDPQKKAWLSYYWDGVQWVRDPFYDFNPRSGLGIDPDLSNQYSDQFTVGLDHQLLEDLSIGAKYVRKRDRNTYGGEDIGSTWVPVQWTASNDQTLTVYTGDPLGDRFRYLTNDPTIGTLGGEAYRDYDGVQLKVIKRLADNWSFIASWMIQKAEGNITNTSTGVSGSQSSWDNPNDFVGTPGELPNSRRHVLKVQGSWLTPDPIRLLLGFQLDYASSARWSITERISSDVSNTSSGDREVPIEEYGSRTINDFFNLNFRAEKKIRLPGGWGDLGVLFDVFNVTNEPGITNIFQRVPFYGEPTAIQSAREWRLGFRWLF